MVFESRVGEVFLLGASSWRVEDIGHDRVLVSPAPGEPGKMPFWHGDRPGRPLEFGQAVGAFVRTIASMSDAEAMTVLQGDYTLDENGATNLVRYLREQQADGALPNDRCVVLERFLDEVGDWRICILSPFGSRVHAPWAMAVSETRANKPRAAAKRPSRPNEGTGEVMAGSSEKHRRWPR